MAAMASQQKTFMTENSTLFEETPSGLRDHKQSMCEWELEEDESAPVCLGPGRSAPTPLETNYTCILCQVGSFSLITPKNNLQHLPGRGRAEPNVRHPGDGLLCPAQHGACAKERRRLGNCTCARPDHISLLESRLGRCSSHQLLRACDARRLLAEILRRCL